jgi:hypothetical protein
MLSRAAAMAASCAPTARAPPASSVAALPSVSGAASSAARCSGASAMPRSGKAGKLAQAPSASGRPSAARRVREGGMRLPKRGDVSGKPGTGVGLRLVAGRASAARVRSPAD